MYFLSIVLNLLKLVLLVTATGNNEGDGTKYLEEIVFVNLIYRHGARTPNRSFPNDKHKHAFPQGFGQLTNEGKMQQYELGKWFRERYGYLLTEKYSPENIYVMSSDEDRVLMSAQCNLAGMYPPKDDQVWSEQLPLATQWQPIPIHMIPEKMDDTKEGKVYCPAYNKALKEVLKSSEVVEQFRKFDYIIDILNQHTGETRNDYKYIPHIYDIFFVQSQNNLDLPKWADDIFPQPMEEQKIIKYKTATWNSKLARLHTGPLLEDMINNMKNKRDKKTTRNVHVYAARDTTIANLLNTLQVYDNKLIPYAASVMMELGIDSNGVYNVMLFYRRSATEKLKLLKIPGCEEICPLDQFIALTKDVIPVDWEKECHEAT